MSKQSIEIKLLRNIMAKRLLAAENFVAHDKLYAYIEKFTVDVKKHLIPIGCDNYRFHRYWQDDFKYN